MVRANVYFWGRWPTLMAATASVLTWLPMADAGDVINLQRDGKVLVLSGLIEVAAQDGGLLVRTPDNVLWAVQPDQILSQSQDDKPFQLLSRKALTQQLLGELPFGFRVHHTAHYTVLYNTSEPFAHWCGSLFERLYRGFYNYWRKRGLKLSEPEQPLVALVFDDQAGYAAHTEPELGEAAASIVGYYSLRTNRINTYDLTGVGDLRRSASRPRNTALVNQILMQPSAAPLVATLIHEATHQLAYSSGLQQRYADNPLWLSEGLAMYFETPDLRHAKGWRSIGAVNTSRLREFRAGLSTRHADALPALLTDDQRLRNAGSASAGYAEAWAFCYFLLHRYPRQLVAYIQDLSQQPLLVYDSPAERLQRFAPHFGGEFAELDAEFLRFMRGVRP